MSRVDMCRVDISPGCTAADLGRAGVAACGVPLAAPPPLPGGWISPVSPSGQEAAWLLVLVSAATIYICGHISHIPDIRGRSPGLLYSWQRSFAKFFKIIVLYPC